MGIVVYQNYNGQVFFGCLFFLLVCSLKSAHIALFSPGLAWQLGIFFMLTDGNKDMDCMRHTRLHRTRSSERRRIQQSCRLLEFRSIDV